MYTPNQPTESSAFNDDGADAQRHSPMSQIRPHPRPQPASQQPRNIARNRHPVRYSSLAETANRPGKPVINFHLPAEDVYRWQFNNNNNNNLLDNDNDNGGGECEGRKHNLGPW